MHPHGIARELARQRELSIARETARPRLPHAPLAAELLPTVSVVVGVLLALALGAPLGPV
jgi:hypothetical protein